MKKPLLCLSIRQSWAWLIVQGYKIIENRTWATPYRGLLLIHAGKGMTLDEYNDCRIYAEPRGVQIPNFDRLQRGGIVGTARLVDCVTAHPSPWFVGPFGFVLEDAQAIQFIPCPGELKLFMAAADVAELVTEATA
jgi:hypothetical protein